MTYQVRVSASAVDDMVSIQKWIAEQAGAEIASAYIERIRAKFMTLENFPMRGTARDDLIPGLRTIAFERRLVIGYRVIGKDVWIERIVSGARSEEVWH